MILRPQDKDLIINIAYQTIQTPCKLVAYGSRVSGEAHETSDLDMVLIADDKKKIDIEEVMKFKEVLQESNIPILTQVFDWYRLPESFHKNILTNYEELVKIGKVD